MLVHHEPELCWKIEEAEGLTHDGVVSGVQGEVEMDGLGPFEAVDDAPSLFVVLP